MPMTWRPVHCEECNIDWTPTADITKCPTCTKTDLLKDRQEKEIHRIESDQNDSENELEELKKDNESLKYELDSLKKKVRESMKILKYI